MPETKESALKRAAKEGFDKSSVQKGTKGWYIIPHGITDPKAKRAYIGCRDEGGKPSTCAAIAHNLQNE